MNKEVNRNAPCPCGSGKKYKNCCQYKGAGLQKKKPSVLLAVIILAAVFGAGAAVMKLFSAEKSNAAATASTGQSFNAQPPGPIPEGKVWSVEHGHWHNIETGRADPVAPASASTERTPKPQPPGPVPEGKVWSEEHGHWHNKPGYVSPAQDITFSADEVGEEMEDVAEESEPPTDFEEVEENASTGDAS